MSTITLPPLHPQESERLVSLEALGILDTPAEATYDELVDLAASICEVPIAVISLIDRNRQWFKAKVGLDAPETPREVAFCAYCILGDSVMEVSDATQDIRFKDNPLVTGEPNIRFYAGAPLFTSDGLPLGSLCVIATEPRKLSNFQKNTLLTLARQVSAQLELRRTNMLRKQHENKLSKLNETFERILRMVSHDLRAPFQNFIGTTTLLESSIKQANKDEISACISGLKAYEIETYSIMENLLDWAALETKSQSTNQKNVYLSELINPPTRKLSVAISEKQIDLEMDIPTEVVVKADPKLIASVIRNLISNAIKFTPVHGKIQILTTIENGWLKLTISDSGIGLSEEQIEKILHRKTLISTAGTEGERGSGIGFQLIHNFLESHCTELSVESRAGGGTSVSFSLLLA